MSAAATLAAPSSGGSGLPPRPRIGGQTIFRLSFENTPALFAGFWLAAGILVAQRAWIVPGILLIAVFLAMASTLASARAAPRISLAPLACCWFLLGMFLHEAQPAPNAQRDLISIADNGGKHALAGEVVRTTPVRATQSALFFSKKEQEEESESIDLRLRSVDGMPVTGGVRATVYAPVGEPFPAFRCGDVVHATAAMHPPERYLDPGVWDSTAWLLGQGVGVIGTLDLHNLADIPSGRHAEFRCRLRGIQQAGTERLLAYVDTPGRGALLPQWLRLSHDDAAMLSAMVLGDRTYLDRAARTGFERTGSFHLLVVSGMHLAIFAGLLFALARMLRLSRLWATMATILCSLGYALITGFGDPVQRSFWMVTLYLLARLFFRERNSLNAVGFAGLCLLAWNPHAISDASFQMTLLSVLVVAGIVLPIAESSFAPYLRATRHLEQIAMDAALPPQIAQFRVTLRMIAGRFEPFVGRRAAHVWTPRVLRVIFWIVEMLLVSSAIELAMALPMAVYFHRVTLLALPVNIFLVPLVALALPAALLTFAAILIAPSIAAVPSAATAAVLHGIAGIVHFFGGLAAGNMRIPAPGPWAVAVSMLLIGLAIWAAHCRRWPAMLALGALTLSAVCVFWPRSIVHRPGTLQITAIDVGQGDSLLLISPEGKTLLIDAGGPIGGAEPSATSNFEIGEDVVSPVLWSFHIRRLDAVELTHAHSDHMGGMPAVLENFRPKELWVGKNPPIPAYNALLGEARSLGVRVRPFAAGDSFDFAGAHVEVLSPAPDYVPGKEPVNDDSLVIRVSYQGTSALLEGDAESRSEKRMLAEDLPSNLLKVGHHGSSTSTTPPFLAQVHPQYAIVSVAHRNPYGHPRIEVLDRLQADRVLTFRTDALGATTFYLDGKTVSAEPLAEDAAAAR
ncbi:MAG TPA: ComEC/Rec2 family competence protein [Acidobacteriaceae bacterium]|nr:ComEC/Rec2 family competence protein [Acidobacteriaceae bacterium]